MCQCPPRPSPAQLTSDQLRLGPALDHGQWRQMGPAQPPQPPSGRGMDQDINIPGLVLVPVVRLAPSHPRPLATRHAHTQGSQWSQSWDDALFAASLLSLHTGVTCDLRDGGQRMWPR